MSRLISILMGILVVAAVVVFSGQAVAGGRHHGGPGWHHGGPGRHYIGPGRYHGAVRWNPGWYRVYPRPVPRAVIVDDWDDCRVVRRCLVDRFGYNRCRWIEVCP